MNSVVLIDAQEIFRLGIKSHINASDNFFVIDEASEGDKGIELIARERPDLVIIDLFLEKGSAMDVLKYVSRHNSHTKTIVISAHDELIYLNQCLEHNVNGFLLRYDRGIELLKAMKKVMENEFYLSQRMSNRMVSGLLKKRAPWLLSEDTKITSRELEILNQIKTGLSTTDIADKLRISHRTVETHRTNLFKKLLVKNSIELINKAKHLSLID